MVLDNSSQLMDYREKSKNIFQNEAMNWPCYRWLSLCGQSLHNFRQQIIYNAIGRIQLKTQQQTVIFTMGNDIQTSSQIPPNPKRPQIAIKNRLMPLFSFQSNLELQEDDKLDEETLTKLPQRANKPPLCASKHLFSQNKTRSIPTPPQNGRRISYRKYQDKSKDLREYEENGCKLTPITFSTFCSIEELQMAKTQQNSQDSIKQHSRTDSHLQYLPDQEENKQIDLVFEFLTHFIAKEQSHSIQQEQFIRIKKCDIHKDYEFHQKIGQGAFGEVYRGIVRRTGEERAVKVLKRNIFSNPRVKQQFLQQFNILKRTSHPNILRIFEIYQFDNFMYIVSELCAGGTLADLLKRIPRPNQQLTQEILRQLFRGVNYLHTLSILHRDIKPQNLAFARQLHEDSIPEDVDLKIIDFGLSVEEQEKVFKDWAKIGTISYMAPQVFDGVYSIKCDSWSCGVVMYQLITGSNPFKCLSPLQTRQMIHSFVPDPFSQRWNQMLVENKQIVLKLLDINYINRMKISDAIRHNFFSDQQYPIDNRGVALKMVNYYPGNSLISTLQSYLSFTHLSQRKRKEYSHAFNRIDSERNGIISKEQLATFLSQFAPELSLQEIHHIFKKINKNSSQSISFGQFINIFLQKKQLFSRILLQNAFGAIDVNNNKYLDKQQVRYFLKSLSKDEIDQLFRNFHPTQNGRIDVEVFVGYILQQTS